MVANIIIAVILNLIAIVLIIKKKVKIACTLIWLSTFFLVGLILIIASSGT